MIILLTQERIIRNLTCFPDSSADKKSTCNAGDPSWLPGSGRSTAERISCPLQYSWASLMVQLVKNLPAMWETWVWSLGWEDSPGEGNGYPLQYSGLENYRYSPWDHKESERTERLSLNCLQSWINGLCVILTILSFKSAMLALRWKKE